jgi:hypothetical protein
MPRRGFELTSSWSGVRRSNQIASWPVELVFISGGFYKCRPIWSNTHIPHARADLNALITIPCFFFSASLPYLVHKRHLVCVYFFAHIIQYQYSYLESTFFAKHCAGHFILRFSNDDTTQKTNVSFDIWVHCWVSLAQQKPTGGYDGFYFFSKLCKKESDEL